MPGTPQETLFQTEERHKEKVYKNFDSMRSSARKSVDDRKADVNAGAYEDQEAFTVYSSLAGATKSLAEAEALVAKLYRKPYFAHIEAQEEGESSSEHYYLSDCESLERTVFIGHDGYLLPFKQDRERPISIALFHCYQSKKGEPVSYSALGETYTLIPQIICDDEINNRHLIDAVQLFPESEILQITADELLEEKLQENRNNPQLRNIISTLQRMQFEIIETDEDTSFVVQGCAGSGKSQCLLHRLFFLRDTLSEEGWNHVLLLTPTQLFRNYSAELMRRYQLSNIENCSIAQLYQRLLNAYDVRFRSRQYHYEISEEYLPDGYLKEVYDSQEISAIDNEISKAITNYVSAGCKALGAEMPESITSVEINRIVQNLDRELKEFDARENVLQQDKAYAEKREQYEQIQKRIDSLQKRRDKLLENHEQNIKENESIEQLRQALEEAEKEREEWTKQRDEDRTGAIRNLVELADQWNRSEDVQLPSRYAQQLYLLKDILSGERFRADNEYAAFLDEYCNQANEELQKLLKKQNPDRDGSTQGKRKTDDLDKAEGLLQEINELTAEADKYADWLREQAAKNEGETSRRTLRRSEMERARYFLSRIESTVFEREVWNALTPLKEKYHIQTLQIDALQDGHQRETRILYKSDLLFYLKIYAALYPDAILPDYRMICVDEGQDLHKADYDILHKLYPQAVFNVFGDTEQVLHTACGIHDWKTETGIGTVYSLNKNYRNTAAIVDFCNRSFGSQMEYIGTIKKSQQPNREKDPIKLKTAIHDKSMVLIVKDRKALEQFCMTIGEPASDFEYLDTRAERQNAGKIPCFSIYAAKGLEFSNVLVYSRGMTINQKVVACTRAMEELYYYE